MGIFNSISDAIGGIVADQFIDAYTAQPFDEYTVLSPAIPKDGEPVSIKKSLRSISNGSRIYVPEGTAGVIVDQAGLSEILYNPGGYQYWNGRNTVFYGEGANDAIMEQVKDRIVAGGKLLDDKRILFVNLREIRNIKFGTKGQHVYHDSFYDVDLGLRAFGTFSILVTDVETFIRNYVPANTEYYTFEEQNSRAQLVGELIQAFMSALNTVTAEYRITDLPSKTEIISDQIKIDKTIKSWEERFGISLMSIAIQNIELTEDAKDLVNSFSSKRMGVRAFEGVSQKAADISAQQNISEGIKEHGLSDGAGTIIGLNIAKAVGEPSKDSSIDDQMALVRKYKELLDEGILTEEEFNKKKAEVLGL